MRHPDYFQVLVAIDQLLNTLIGGMADETLSARAYRRYLRGKPWCARIINIIFFWQENHCKEAYESELERSQLPKEYLKEENINANDK